MKLLVTGGAGFIGSTFVRLVLSGEVTEEADGLRACELKARREADGALVLTGWTRAWI